MIDFEVTAYKFPQSRQSSKVLNSDLAGAKCKFGFGKNSLKASNHSSDLTCFEKY